MGYTLHLLKNFNNYYNRQLIKRNTVSNYITDSNIYILSFSHRNVDFGDRKTIEHIINYQSALVTPNYCLIEEEYQQIGTGVFTRWFVISCEQIRGLQYKLVLKRDVIAEYYDTILTSPAFIKKGWAPNSSVYSLIKEDMTFNEIKQNEALLKDETQIGYVIGFVARNTAESADINVSGSIPNSVPADFTYSNLADFENEFAYYDLVEGGGLTHTDSYKVHSNEVICYQTDAKDDNSVNASHVEIAINVAYNAITDYLGYTPTYEHDYGNGISYNVYYTSMSIIPLPSILCHTVYGNGAMPATRTVANLIASNVDWYSWRINVNDDREFRNFLISKYSGKTFKIGANKYRASIVHTDTIKKIDLDLNEYLYDEAIRYLPRNNVLAQFNLEWRTENDGPKVNKIYYNYVEESWYIQLEQIQESVVHTIIPQDRAHLIDAPYDMFVIPYDDNMKYYDGTNEFTANKTVAINMATAICMSSGTASYDIQIVPYCPLNSSFDDLNNRIDFSIYTPTYIKNASNVNIGCYYWCFESTKSFVIPFEIMVENFKKSVNLEKYRLCSPDKSTIWEFSPAMNNGINVFNVKFNYRPYSSYFRIYPTWGGLYGEYQEDLNGLIFNGSYSLTQLSDAWANYVSSNKNYQSIFDTKINTEVKGYGIQNEAAWETMFARSYKSTSIIGSALSAWGNSKEQIMTEELQNLNISSQKQIFNLKLGSIQAQPYGITKMISINSDFKIFPFVEFYKCSNAEEHNFEESMRFNGYTINANGHISDYLQPGVETYIEAVIVRYVDPIGIEGDYDIVAAINAELNRGVYIIKEE